MAPIFLIFSTTFKWFTCVKYIFDNCGLSYVWLSQVPGDCKWIGSIVKSCVQDQYIQSWHSSIDKSEKCLNYRLFKKKEYSMDDYLTKLPCKYRKSLCQLRLSSHVLPIEQGRYRHVNRNERYCLLCNEDKIGDEFHFILECKALVYTKVLL